MVTKNNSKVEPSKEVNDPKSSKHEKDAVAQQSSNSVPIPKKRKAIML
jgi:hypothetical protein